MSLLLLLGALMSLKILAEEQVGSLLAAAEAILAMEELRTFMVTNAPSVSGSSSSLVTLKRSTANQVDGLTSKPFDVKSCELRRLNATRQLWMLLSCSLDRRESSR